MELDGVWNRRAVVWSVIGILVGIFLYFGAKNFVLHPAEANGKILLPNWMHALNPAGPIGSFLLLKVMPLVGSIILGARIIQYLMTGPGKNPPFQVPATRLLLTVCASLIFLGMASPGHLPPIQQNPARDRTTSI